jgi:hypothetical protein
MGHGHRLDYEREEQWQRAGATPGPGSRSFANAPSHEMSLGRLDHTPFLCRTGKRSPASNWWRYDQFELEEKYQVKLVRCADGRNRRIREPDR